MATHSLLLCLVFVVCVCTLATLSSSYKDISHIGLGPLPNGLFELSHLFKDPISKYLYTLRYWGLGLQHMNSEGDHNSAITNVMVLYT